MREGPLNQRLWHVLALPTRLVPSTLLALVARLLPPPLRVASSAHFVVMRHPLRSIEGSSSATMVLPLRIPC